MRFVFACFFCLFLFMVAHDMYPNVLNMSTKHDSPKGSLLKLFTLKTNGWNPKIKNVLKLRQQACVSYGSGCDSVAITSTGTSKCARAC